jgi:hypothetical protein
MVSGVGGGGRWRFGLPKGRRKMKEDLEQARLYTMLVVMEIRRLYLTAGANPLKHWEQLATRLRAAARTTAGVGEWVTSMLRSLGIPSPDKSLSLKMCDLEEEVSVVSASKWLDMLEREGAYIIALCQVEADERRVHKESRGGVGHGTNAV